MIIEYIKEESKVVIRFDRDFDFEEIPSQENLRFGERIGYLFIEMLGFSYYSSETDWYCYAIAKTRKDVYKSLKKLELPLNQIKEFCEANDIK